MKISVIKTIILWLSIVLASLSVSCFAQTPASLNMTAFIEEQNLSFEGNVSNNQIMPQSSSVEARRFDRYKNAMPVIFRLTLKDDPNSNNSSIIKLKNTDYKSPFIMLSIIKRF